MTIADILDPNRVQLGVDVASKKRVLETLGTMLSEHSTELPAKAVIEQLFARERLGSTALGDGVAIPHGRVDAIETAVGGFIRLDHPVDFEAPDGAPVDLVFGLIVPAECTDEHLELLAELAGRLSEDETREALRGAGNSHAAFGLLASSD